MHRAQRRHEGRLGIPLEQTGAGTLPPMQGGVWDRKDYTAVRARPARSPARKFQPTAPTASASAFLGLRARACYAEAHGLAAWCHIQRIWAEAPDLNADLSSAVAHARAVMTIRTDD